MLDRRLECLDERLRELDTLARAFVAADGPTVGRAASAAAGMTPLERCDEAAVAREPPLPADPARRAVAVSLRPTATTARVFLRLGRYGKTLALVDGALPGARDAAHPPVLLELLVLGGRTAQITGDFEKGRRLLGEAVVVAEAAGDDRRRAHAMVDLVFGLGWGARDAARAHEVARQVEAVLERIGGDQGETDHLYLLEGTNARRLTTNEGAERHMIFTPDGNRIAYSIQNTGGVSNLYLRAADGSGQDQPLIVSEGMHKWYPSFTPDASAIVFHTNSPNTEVRDLGYLVIATGETGVLVGDNGIQALARISRDGRFVAYQSDQDGRAEIYVTTFPKSDARWKVSTNGGTWPKWSNNELFYWEGNSLMAVSFTTEGGFRPATPRRLFTGAQAGMGADNMMNSYNPEYDVSADGTRFAVTQRP
jgi:hypothetical protein